MSVTQVKVLAVSTGTTSPAAARAVATTAVTPDDVLTGKISSFESTGSLDPVLSRGSPRPASSG